MVFGLVDKRIWRLNFKALIARINALGRAMADGLLREFKTALVALAPYPAIAG